jgi:sugar transferase (PEP-CTERM/EpsH1 system associated)
MARDLIFLSHCMPYPPDKGEKIRAWHLINHLARDFRVHLGCVVGHPADMAHIDAVRSVCASVAAFPIDSLRQRMRALLRARPGRPLMPDCYTSPALRRWVQRTVAEQTPALIYIYTVAMAPHALHLPARKLLDAVDIDSEKWREFATRARFPMRAIWAREGRNLLRYERAAAALCDAVFFVSDPEARRFAGLAPESGAKISAVENGVDLVRFSPGHSLASPYTGPGPHLVFTGHMDYWPNEDAVGWFATDILKRVRETVPAQFWIVGANPTQVVRGLAALPGVHVTGRVDDTRPYLAHADICVCPLRLARGIQNKVLEAMAMGRPVIASAAAFEGVRARAGQDLLVADDAAGFAAQVLAVLGGDHPTLAARARAVMAAHYAWANVLGKLDRFTLSGGGPGGGPDGAD